MNTHVINYMYYYWEDLDPHMLYYCYLRLNSWLLVSDNSYQFSALIKITVTKFSSPFYEVINGSTKLQSLWRWHPYWLVYTKWEFCYVSCKYSTETLYLITPHANEAI
jgi:hypothetical protein